MSNPTLPGIDEATIEAAGIRYVDDAHEFIGLCYSGILIPYYYLDGEPVEDKGRQYARLQMHTPKQGEEYHEPKNSGIHVYYPPTIRQSPSLDTLAITSTEVAALALCDHGWKAVALNGFRMFKENEWVDLLLESNCLLGDKCPNRVIVIGDRDSLFDLKPYSTSLAVKQVFTGVRTYIVQLPYTARAETIDACRACMSNEDFTKLIDQAPRIEVTERSTAGRLAVKCLREQMKVIKELVKEETESDALLDQFTQLAVQLEQDGAYAEAEQIKALAVEATGVSVSVFKKLVKGGKGKPQHRRQAPVVDDETVAIDVSQQQGVWADEAAKKLSEHLYWHIGGFARLADGKLEPLSPTGIATFLDRPKRCRFYVQNADGTERRVSLTSKQAEYITGAADVNRDLVREVKVLGRIPILKWKGKEFQIITEYDAETCILTEGVLPELPTPAEAADMIRDLLRDYRFASGYDNARCIAFLLSPAIARSGVLDGEQSPFFAITKDRHGAGGSYLAEAVAAMYAMNPGPVTPSDKNPEKTAREDISRFLADGNTFIYLDNIRGAVLKELPFFEALITGTQFMARSLYFQKSIDVTGEVFACSSNGALMSPDLADRVVEITIHKQPDGYQYYSWPDGKLHLHVKGSRLQLLAAIYALIIDYGENGINEVPPPGQLRFPEWEKCVSWIIKKHFPELPGLLEADYGRKQAKLAEPNLDILVTLLRHVALNCPGKELQTSEMIELARENGVDLGAMNDMVLGKLLAKKIPDEGVNDNVADRFRVTKRTGRSESRNKTFYYKVEFMAGVGSETPDEDPPSAGVIS